MIFHQGSSAQIHYCTGLNRVLFWTSLLCSVCSPFVENGRYSAWPRSFFFFLTEQHMSACARWSISGPHSIQTKNASLMLWHFESVVVDCFFFFLSDFRQKLRFLIKEIFYLEYNEDRDCVKLFFCVCSFYCWSSHVWGKLLGTMAAWLCWWRMTGKSLTQQYQLNSDSYGNF